jgi:DNA (cytosine-5)-methyltransferase 1
MNVVSTFAGCGGSSTGYKMAGCEVVACVEWDAHAVECYRANHPSTQVFQDDIANVTGEMLLNATGLDVGELDILDGSPPCQGFSTAGKRILDDPRNRLFKQQLRLIDELKPKHVVIENVSGMVKGQMKSIAGEIVLSLKERGYRVAAGVLEAQYFGVAQFRPRTFFIASRVLQPALPKAISRPIPCRVALSGVEPDALLYPKSPIGKLLCQHMIPGKCGKEVMLRLGKKARYWNIKMLHPDKPAQTILKSLVGEVAMFHWERRQLSIREALVLTGFPLDYLLPGAFKDRWARIGNSVAPPMSREIAQQIFGARP